MTNRITRKMVEARATTLNTVLNLPTEPWTRTDSTLTANIGNIHVGGCYGYLNIYQMCNVHGGVHALAYGLSAREAYQWLTAALEGIRLARTPFPQ